MATTAIKATAAAVHVKLDGKTYRLSPLTDENLAEFRLWVEQRYIELAKRNLDGLEDAQANELLRHAFDRAADVDLTGSEGMRLMASPDGAVKLLWLSLLNNHPSVTEEWIRKILQNEETLREAMESIEKLNQPSRDSVKKARRRSRKAKRPH